MSEEEATAIYGPLAERRPSEKLLKYIEKERAKNKHRDPWFRMSEEALAGEAETLMRIDPRTYAEKRR